MKDEDNCDPAYGTDWADTDIMSVMGAAKAGIPGAVAQLEKWEKELLLSIDPVSTNKSVTNTQPELLHGEKDIDTVRGKALDLSQIRVEWIEE